jgi:hypothetical protein
MPEDRVPQWHPISALPMIAQALDGMVESAEEVLQSLEQARPRPHVLDDYTIGRVRAAPVPFRASFFTVQRLLHGFGPTTHRLSGRAGGIFHPFQSCTSWRTPFLYTVTASSSLPS